MALPISSTSPLPDDLMTLRMARVLLRRTPHCPAESTLRGWIRRYGIRRYKFDDVPEVCVSFSEVLEAQRDANRGSRRR